ncbi:MAG TPA: baseplate protein [Enterobacteriaceae bacterium]|nr:baseplate protein [Enterobacteriaceae bacterium]
MNDNVTLRVNGKEWRGWTTVRIGAGVERLARDFTVGITRSWPGDEGNRTLEPGIKNGARVEVLIGEERVLTGWVEATPVSYDAKSVTAGISGRSLTADLIDCSAEPVQFNGRSLIQIAEALAAPFNIAVINAGAPDKPIPGVQPGYGETVLAVLNKMLGQQPALIYDSPLGEMVIGRLGAEVANTALVFGHNILSAKAEKSVSGRFSRYQVAGQSAGNNTNFAAATTSGVRAQSTDPLIARYRPLHLRQTGQATIASCMERAEFEARKRAAKTDSVTYEVQGWRQGDGTLWQPNQRVIVSDPNCGFDKRELLIAETTYIKDQSGTRTELKVAPVDGWLPTPKEKG